MWRSPTSAQGGERGGQGRGGARGAPARVRGEGLGEAGRRGRSDPHRVPRWHSVPYCARSAAHLASSSDIGLP